MEIFKMQRPLYTNGSDEVLVYNDDRTKEFMMPASPSVLALFGDEVKIFVTGELRHDEVEDEPEFHVEKNHGGLEP